MSYDFYAPTECDSPAAPAGEGEDHAPGRGGDDWSPCAPLDPADALLVSCQRRAGETIPITRRLGDVLLCQHTQDVLLRIPRPMLRPRAVARGSATGPGAVLGLCRAPTSALGPGPLALGGAEEEATGAHAPMGGHAPGRGEDRSLRHGPRGPAAGDQAAPGGTGHGPPAVAAAAEEEEEDDDNLPKQRGGRPGRRGALAPGSEFSDFREALAAPQPQDAAISPPESPRRRAGGPGAASTWPKAPPCTVSTWPKTPPGTWLAEDCPTLDSLAGFPGVEEFSISTPSTASNPTPNAAGRPLCLGALAAEELSTPSTASNPTPGAAGRPRCLGALAAEELHALSAASRPQSPRPGLGSCRGPGPCGRSSSGSSSEASRGSGSPGSRGCSTLPRQQWPGWPNACVPRVPSLRDWEVRPSGRGGALGAGHEKVFHDERGRPGSPTYRPLGLEHFDFIQTVGTGFLGHVSVVKMRALGGAPLALKVMEKSTVLAKKQVQHVLNERQIMSSIRHPFCVSLVASFQDDTRLVLLMDYISGGELFSYTRLTKGLQTSVARFFASEIALALQYLHERDVVYRDLKPENVLLDNEGHVKITDFGFAKVIKDRTYTICGSAVYMAPEIINEAGHGKPVDWWAFGVFVFELLTGTTPFVGRPADVYRQACCDEVRFPGCVTGDERDLIGRLMTKDPSRRLGSDVRLGEASEVKAHPWFGTLDWDRVIQKRYQPPLAPWPAR